MIKQKNSSKVPQKVENPFDWQETMKHLETLSDRKAQLNYLISRNAEYNQGKFSFLFNPPLELPFNKKCEIEIQKIEELLKIDSLHIEKDKNENPNFRLKLSTRRKGAMTDLIRVLNALYELGFFNDESGQLPTKIDFMAAFGQFLGVKMTHFQKALSQGRTTQKLEVVLNIFELMQKITSEDFYKNDSKQKRK